MPVGLFREGTVRKIVVFFDICSSTMILEDLLQTENEEKWRKLLIRLKEFLRARRKSLQFSIYKFLGDGWVLLFPIDVDGVALMAFLKELNNHYLRHYKKRIEPWLTRDVPNVGLTCGIDRGRLLKMIMNKRKEYAGRPLNVAARLQGSIGQKDKHPECKVLMSNSVYNEIADQIRDTYLINSVRRTLKNISGESGYRCRKLWLNKPPKK